MLAELFTSGRVVDWIVLFMVVECFLLLYLRRGLRPLELSVGLGAGLCLLLALREALTGARWQFIALWLAASLVAHLGDLHLRLKGARP